MSRTVLTEKYISSPKRVPAEGRADYQDALVPGLALRVTHQGHRSFVLIARYPTRPKNPTRRALGDHGELTLEEARDKARAWLAMIQKGIDPKIEQARERAEAARVQANTFGQVAEQYLQRGAANLANAAELRRTFDREFVRRWGYRPVTDIMPEEVAGAIRAIVERGASYGAHSAFAGLRRMFNWAIGTHEFGLAASPLERLSPRDLIGAREARERILTDAELRAVWGAAEAMGYPFGPFVRTLILTGQRVAEVADMTWSEIEFGKALWTVPAVRMKGGRVHEVPLASKALDLLEALPRFTGNFVFTTTSGERPVSGFSKAKARLDRLCGVEGWRFHDLRRTMRTHLSALPVQDLVRELTIAHARPGLHKVYDLHSYQDEKRECLRLWEARLSGLVGVSGDQTPAATQPRTSHGRNQVDTAT